MVTEPQRKKNTTTTDFDSLLLERSDTECDTRETYSDTEFSARGRDPLEIEESDLGDEDMQYNDVCP